MIPKKNQKGLKVVLYNQSSFEYTDYSKGFVRFKVLATVLNGPYNIKELFILNFVTNDRDGYQPNSKITVYELIFCSYKVQVVLWDNIT